MKDPKGDMDTPEAFYKDEFHRYNLTNSQKKEIKAELAKVLKQVDKIKFAFLHGSFTEKGSFRDIDIAIFLKEELSGETGLDVCNRLSVKLTNQVGYPVDVNLLNTASLGFCYHAVQGQVLIYSEMEEVYQFKEDIFIKYMDFYPFIKENLTDLLT